MTILEIAQRAWEAVKKPDDASWDALPFEYGVKLVDLVDKYAAGIPVAEGDYPPEGFAEKVREIASSQFIDMAADPVHAVVSGVRVEDGNLILDVRAKPPIHLFDKEVFDEPFTAPDGEADPVTLDAIGPEVASGKGNATVGSVKPKKEAKKK